MGRAFADIAFTPSVKAAPTRYGANAARSRYGANAARRVQCAGAHMYVCMWLGCSGEALGVACGEACGGDGTLAKGRSA